MWGPVYALPAVGLIGVFFAYPMGSIVYHSFTRWDGINPAQWVGFHNFEVLLSDNVFRTALINNLIFAISVPVQLVVPLLVAYLIHIRLPGWKIYRATVFLPAVYATVIVGILISVGFQLDGPVNSFLSSVGLGSLRRQWLGSAGSSIPIILLAVIWSNFGYNVLLYLAGMSALDPSLEEAARTDGARGLRVLWHAVVPNLKRVMEIVLVVNTITAFAFMFAYIYTITSGGPGFDTYVSDFYIYNQAFQNQNMGYAAAIGVVLVLLMLIVGALQIRVLTKERA
jgi:ABC-type sugar transport system permease subunit